MPFLIKALSVCRPRYLILGWHILAFLLLSATTASGQDTQPDVIRVYSNLVSVPVIVSDRDGRYIPGLRKENFTLLDNNLEQKLSYFDAAEEPLNIALLLDTSRSTQGVFDDIRKAAKDFIRDLRSQDRAMVVSFDYEVHKLCSLTSDRTVLEQAIKNARVGEYFGTLLNDAVEETVERDLKPINGRKAIILLTDGEDAGSRITDDELLAYASESDAMIYSIYYAPSIPRFFRRDRPFPRREGIFGGRRRILNQMPQGPPGRGQRRQRQGERRESAQEFLARLSEVSAGRFYLSQKTDLKKTFAMIAEELRNQYRLGFYPDELARDGSLHRLKVKIDKPNLAVRARTQYRAVKSQNREQ